MISVDQAKRLVLKEILPLKETEVLRFSSCLDRVSAVDIRSKENIPPFDNSAMDGFAVKAKDTIGASKTSPKIVEVIENLPAGYTAKKTIKPNQAIRIMTGAPLPHGADAVVMVENTRIKSQIPNPKHPSQEYIEILKEVRSGENVRYAGEDVKKGEVVIKKGMRLGPGHIGMLASLGVSKVKVFRRSKVAILATGDELVSVGAYCNTPLPPGKIRNSNTYSLCSQVEKMGAVPIILGIARDKKMELEKKIRKGLTADMLLVSGGVSVGDYDFVKLVLKKIGADMKFWKVAMRPGKPLAFGIVNKAPVFGLPGNPVSSMVSFEIFVKPAISKMMGQRIDEKTEVAARIEEDISKKRGLRYFLRANTHSQDGKYLTKTTGPQGSGILKSMVLANSLIILPEEKAFIKKGSLVKVRFLD